MIRAFGRAALVAACVAVIGCASPGASRATGSVAAGPGIPGGETTAAGQDALSRFAADNRAAFQERRLSNGIRLLVKRSDANRIVAIKTVFSGHVAYVPQDKAGLEALTLSLMAKGSASWDWPTIKRTLYEKSASFGASASSYDLSSLDLVVLEPYLDELLPMYLEALTAPSLNAERFTETLRDFSLSYTRTMADPYSKATALLHAAMFAGHPYASDFQGTDASLRSLSRDDVVAYYPKLVDPARMSVVAVGPVDADALAAILEARLVAPLEAARAARGGAAPTVPSVAPYEAKRDVIVEPFAEARSIAYLRADFPAPSVGSDDYVALQLAFSVLDDLLFDTVRAKHGACYSVWSRVYSFRAPYASIGVYKTDVPDAAKDYVDDAVALLLQGKSIAASVAGPEGAAPGGAAQSGAADSAGGYADLADTLDFYKAKFVSSFYEKQQTNASIAAQAASSYLLQGDWGAYLDLASRVRKVSVDDIVRVVGTYVRDGKATWIVLGDPSLVMGVDRDRFLRPLGLRAEGR